jgi:catechol 2,3-dioxygenase-like lactoylglutathione lyase family enzyme
MKITLTSVVVDDQDKAEAFYVGKLGFIKKQDFAAGGGRWLTVASPEGPEGVELALEPAGFDFAKTYCKALRDNGIPFTAFGVDDIDAEYSELTARGVVFKGPPRKGEVGPATAVFDDTCGNWIMIYQI